MSSPSALCLAAGLATRLVGYREDYAKACVPVGGTTPLAWMLAWLHRAGVVTAVVNLHHHADQVREHALAAKPPGMELRFLEEPVLLGTGGTLCAATELLGAPPHLLANAKLFTDLPAERVLASNPGTFWLHPPSDLPEFGGLRHDGAFVTGLHPRSAPTATEAAVFMGISRPARSLVDRLAKAPQEEPRCLIRDGLLPLLKRGAAFPAALWDRQWLEVSTPERLLRATESDLVRPVGEDAI